MTTAEEVETLFAGWRLAYENAERLRLSSEAIAIAVAAGDEVLEYRARLRHTVGAMYADDSETLLASFAACVAMHDADPARFPARPQPQDPNLMWHFKWVPRLLRANPAFSRAQVEAALDDLEAHYRRAGIGMHGVLTVRFDDARASHRYADAERLRLELERTPRDDHSDCLACTLSGQAAYSAETGRDADAVARVEELLVRGSRCVEEPQLALSVSAIPLLRLGRMDEATRNIERAYRAARAAPLGRPVVARAVIFHVVTGCADGAFDLVERHLGWLAHDPLDLEGLRDTLAAFALGLDAVASEGNGDQLVAVADDERLRRVLGAHDLPWTVAELAARCWQAAERIQRDFDVRDGIVPAEDPLAEVRALSHEHYRLEGAPART